MAPCWLGAALQSAPLWILYNIKKEKLRTAALTCVKDLKQHFAYIFIYFRAQVIGSKQPGSRTASMSKNGRFKAGKVPLR